MVSNILEYAKIKAKKLELDLQPINFRDFMQKIMEMHAVKAKQKNIKLNLTLDEDGLPERLYFDQSRLTNILVNIISNGIKFTQKGGIHVYAHWFPDCGPNNMDLKNEEELYIPSKNFIQRIEQVDSQHTHGANSTSREERKDSDNRLDHQIG